MIRRESGIAGAGFVALYTLMITGADAIIKRFTETYEAPQLFVISAFLVVAFSLGASGLRGGAGTAFRTGAPRAMTLRAGLTVLATFAFFMAFRHLPFADVFVFIALMPLMAGFMSGPCLGEQIRPQSWMALIVGLAGVLCLLPKAGGVLQAGHLWALLAAVTGTGSMVSARYIARYRTGVLAQVFYPNLATGLVMALALPAVWQPMPVGDMFWIAGYAVCLFSARWVLVEALTRLPAYVATPLMNLQFVWMVAIGFWVFGETPGLGTMTGVALVMASGLYLVWLEQAPNATKTATV